jgi:quercetin dioxygenase-like cupin family protein
MADCTIKRVDEMDSIYAGHFMRARAELGVESFGMAVIDIPPGAHQYPEHDHSGDGQEEVYVTLRGDGEIEIEEERHRLDPETMVRVGPGTKRKLWPGEEGIRILALGGVPGKVYEPPEMSKLGGLDPLLTAGR